MQSDRISLKQINRRNILDMFRNSDILSVADISLETGISKPTVQKVVNHFIENGLIITAGKGDSTDDGGKKPNLYSFNSDYGRILSIHLGPDFIYGAVTNLHADIIHSVIRAVDKTDTGRLLDIMADILGDFIRMKELQGTEPLAVAVALPGIVDSENGVSVFTPHFQDLGDNLPVADILKEKLGLNCPCLY